MYLKRLSFNFVIVHKQISIHFPLKMIRRSNAFLLTRIKQNTVPRWLKYDLNPPPPTHTHKPHSPPGLSGVHSINGAAAVSGAERCDWPGALEATVDVNGHMTPPFTHEHAHTHTQSD